MIHQHIKLMDQLMKMNARDRNELLSTSVDRLLGMILKLNRRPRYHNTLDAIQLTSRLIELKERMAKKKKSVPST